MLICMIVLSLPLDFIEAFTDLDRSLDNANRKLDQKNRSTLRNVAEYAQRDSARFYKFYENILDVKEISDSAVNYLDSIKNLLVMQGGGWDPEIPHLKSAIDPSVPTKYMISKGIAKETHDLLIYTKRELMKYLDADEQTALDTVLITKDYLVKATGNEAEWEKYYFNNVPLAAAVALLTKFQNDVRLAENIVVSKHEEEAQRGISFTISDESNAESEKFAFDKVMLERAEKRLDVFNMGEEVTVNVTAPGVPEEAMKQAIIYTYDQKGAILDSFLFKDGVGEIEIPTEQIGEFKIKGVVKFRYMDEGPGEVKEQPENLMEKEKSKEKDKDNDAQKEETKDEKKERIEEQEFEMKYSVINPRPYISHRDYDVLFVGANNPVNIYHPEFTPENYNVSISQGKVSYDGKNFFAKVYRPGYVTMTLNVPEQGGGFKKVAEQQFKVEELPKPRAKLYNSYGGQMPATIFKKQRELTADIQGLPIDAKFRVMEFTLTYVNRQGLGIFKERITGSYFTDKSLELINLAESGDIFIFESIKIKGPDGKNIDVDPLAFTIL
ncbi:MAG: GldM family protein [Chitinophagales bacterium]|nr:GldM family protein [Chitinophagales bacterium]